MDCRFHVYQYMMYTLAMWNSYLFVSALDMFVVVLAGLISIFTARRSQKAIEKVLMHADLYHYACSSSLAFLFCWPWTCLCDSSGTHQHLHR